jgi:hypothetical protein
MPVISKPHDPLVGVSHAHHELALRAADFLRAAQIDLQNNVLLAEPLFPGISRTGCGIQAQP